MNTGSIFTGHRTRSRPIRRSTFRALFWLGKWIKQDIVIRTLDERSQRKWSHDNIFATLLGLFETRSEVYNPAMDLLEHTADEIHGKN